MLVQSRITDPIGLVDYGNGWYKMGKVDQVERRAERHEDAVGKTITGTDASERSKVSHRSAEVPTGVKVMGAPIWRLLVVITALFLSLAWTGFLAWIVARIFGVL
jgi:hypothetical protein